MTLDSNLALAVADSLLKVLAGFAMGFAVRDYTARKGVGDA